MPCKRAARINCKTTAEVRKIDIEFKSDLAASETISTVDTSSVTPTGVTIDSTTISGSKVQVALSTGITPQTFTAATDDKLTLNTTDFVDGQTVEIEANGDETLPTGLEIDTVYYVVSRTGTDVKLAKSSGGDAIDITAAGKGVLFVRHVIFLKCTTSNAQTVEGEGILQVRD